MDYAVLLFLREIRIARRALPLLLAASSVACARRCGGWAAGRPGLPLVVGADGVKRYLDDKGVYRAWYRLLGRLERIEYDKNGDGRADHIAHYAGGRTARLLEVDEAGTGTMDRWGY